MDEGGREVMLNEIVVEDFRHFKDFRIEGLASVNLIVGANNSGKTSFLEAVQRLSGSPCGVVSSNTGVDVLLHSWSGSEVMLTSKKEILIEALQIINPDIEDIGFTHIDGIIIRVTGQSSRVRLAGMGRGIQRILILVTAALSSEGGILLVDEIDTSFSAEVQIDLWELLFRISDRFNVQIFATTHSWDCICAFQSALPVLIDKSAGKLFRLSHKSGACHAVEYTPKELAIAVEQNIEVR